MLVLQQETELETTTDTLQVWILYQTRQPNYGVNVGDVQSCLLIISQYHPISSQLWLSCKPDFNWVLRRLLDFDLCCISTIGNFQYIRR